MELIQITSIGCLALAVLILIFLVFRWVDRNRNLPDEPTLHGYVAAKPQLPEIDSCTQGETFTKEDDVSLPLDGLPLSLCCKARLINKTYHGASRCPKCNKFCKAI